MYNNKNKLILGLVALLTVFSTTVPGQAAEDKKTSAVAKTNAPIVFEGDELSFNDSTGEVYAQGKVKITQNNAVVLADNIRGNTKQSQVWIDGKANFLDQGVNITGLGTHYNYQEHTGTMLDAKGMIDKERIAGNNLEFFPDKYVIQNGTMTRCPAKVPDYHVSASRIEIWPGDKLIAYNAKFWIKNTVIYSTPKYKKDLRKESGDGFPTIGYTSDDGIYISQKIDYPITNQISVFGDLAYYSKSGFKPSFGVTDQERNHTLALTQGDFRDSDGNWVEKEPELRFDYHPRRLGNLPVSYAFTAIYGKWTDDYKSSWHQDYVLYFSHDPIKLNNTMTLYLGTGYEIVRESYNNSTLNSYKYDATVTKAFSPSLNTWVGYHYTQNNSSLFDFNNVDLNRELNSGISYRIDKMNTITYSQSYDLDNKTIYDQDYTWSRNLHCWQADITYRAERDEIRVKLKTLI